MNNPQKIPGTPSEYSAQVVIDPRALDAICDLDLVLRDTQFIYTVPKTRVTLYGIFQMPTQTK